MTNQNTSSLKKEVIESEKKLRKRERKLNEKLQDALNEREAALERLRRAEARAQKRVASVQRLEARLTLVHQQLAAITAATSTPPATPTSQAASEEQPQPSSEVEQKEAHVAEPSRSSTPINVEPEVAQIINTVEITGEILPEETLSAQEALLEQLASKEQVVSPEEVPALSETPETTETTETTEQITTDAQEQTDALAQARAARATAEVAERDARFAAGRAAQATACLEQVQIVGGEAHHLLQETTQLQEEAEHLHALAQEKAYLAQVIEQQVQLPAIRPQTTVTGPLTEHENDEGGEVGAKEEDEDEESDIDIGEDENDEGELLEHDELEHAPPVLIADFDAPPPPLLADYERAMMASLHLYPPPVEVDVSRPLPPTVTKIEEDEELVETVTSMLIAEAAAEAAAQAEAFAEASAARTREVRRRANQADSILQQIILMVNRGILTGKQAEVALLEAERDVAYAQAALADAEATEARAMETAMNAEAEAEVAENMAFSVDIRNQDIERTRPQNSVLFSDLGIDNDEYEDEEETTEMPSIQGVRPREMA